MPGEKEARIGAGGNATNKPRIAITLGLPLSKCALANSRQKAYFQISTTKIKSGFSLGREIMKPNIVQPLKKYLPYLLKAKLDNLRPLKKAA
jgi:hypothetical protein